MIKNVKILKDNEPLKIQKSSQIEDYRRHMESMSTADLLAFVQNEIEIMDSRQIREIVRNDDNRY